MKNNKKLTYILIPVVLIIWGGILFKIMQYRSSDETSGNSIPSYTENKEIAMEKDSFSLIADYNDPFIKRRYSPPKEKSSSAESKVVSTRRNRSPQRSPRVNRRRVRWPNIAYGGVIINENNKELTALINLNNTNRLLYEGDVFEDVTLLEIYNDSIIVSYMDEQKTIPKSNAIR